MQVQAFHKNERINKKKEIQHLFSNGNSFFKYPFKILWIEMQPTNQHRVKILIGVSKKIFKQAAKRNHIKRLIRESYRKNKYILNEHLDKKNLALNIAFLFTGKEIPKYQELEKKLVLILHQIKGEYEKTAK